ncbi:glycosyltransferase [Candidatus Micrarchaeota archaeon]|nr:glycosyltransferase [Candidatus Micrarchaeota archaeon]
MHKKPRVSIIITTKNEEQNIQNCLESIEQQTYPNIELIVVDNASADKTKEIAKRYTKKVFNKGPERSAQRNLGVLKSSGEWIFYLDADQILPPDIIEECVDTVTSNKELVGLHIPEKIMGEGYWIRVRDFEKQFYDGTIIDVARFIKKDVFQKVDGFDPSLSGPEDWDLDKKIRCFGKIEVIKNRMLHNEKQFNLQKYLAKKDYYCGSMEKYVRKWDENDPDINKQLGWRYRLFEVFVENGKWVRLLKHPLLAAGMFALRFLVGITYLRARFGK